jgi:hypothetical protein
MKRELMAGGKLPEKMKQADRIGPAGDAHNDLVSRLAGKLPEVLGKDFKNRSIPAG